MTLHWWMHWFWITYQMYVISCGNITTASVLNVNVAVSTESTNVSDDGTLSHISTPKPTFLPGDKNASAFDLTKLHKTPKKHALSNLTVEEILVVTDKPVVVETATVIDWNLTTTIESNLSLDNTSSYDNVSLLENIAYVGNDIIGNINQTIKSGRLGSAKNVESGFMEGSLSAAGITGITLGCVSIIGIICAVSFVMYRNYGFNRPQVLNDRCSNPDSSGYIDDSTVRENSEEMYSLDNDSFLNSLEAMTIQNLWTDSVKHTKL